ncbi:MAG: hypothetical protein P8J34_06830, partial [Flavobacteriales bacterium]|nr:hypothetical protein [Flavobacteriales bacterium]
MKRLFFSILFSLPLIGFGQTVIFSEDFSAGIPNSWTNSSVPWAYRGPSTSPNQSVGSQGAYAPPTQTPIMSSTAANGFVIFDSDYYDNGGVPGAFGTGSYPTPHTGELTTNMIDMSFYSDLSLGFNSYFRTYFGQAFVDFYVNGVFTERVQVHENLATNDGTSNAEEALIRVPFNVVGNSNVQISFVFDGTNNGDGYYFWMIDDIELYETPLNSIAIESIVGGGFWIDYLNYSGYGFNSIYGLNYSVTPISQLSNHPYAIEGVIRNLGVNDQISRLRYQVSGPSSNVGSSLLSNVLACSSSNSIDSVLLGTTLFSPTSVGNYFASIWGESMQNGIVTTTSDTFNVEFEVSDYIYGKDFGELNSNGSWTLGGPGGQWHFVTRYEMYT